MELTKQEQLELMQEKLFVLKKRINHLKKELGQPLIDEPKTHQCKRCNYIWRSRITHRDPTNCPHCHSGIWFEEPLKKSVKWVEDHAKEPMEKKSIPVRTYAPTKSVATMVLPPPPKFERPSLSAQLAERIKANVPQSPEHYGAIAAVADPPADQPDDSQKVEESLGDAVLDGSAESE